jgi:hypothetical protein
MDDEKGMREEKRRPAGSWGTLYDCDLPLLLRRLKLGGAWDGNTRATAAMGRRGTLAIILTVGATIFVCLVET